MSALNEWRDTLISGTDLQQTDLNKKYNPKICAPLPAPARPPPAPAPP
jgi:hypothetical protein